MPQASALADAAACKAALSLPPDFNGIAARYRACASRRSALARISHRLPAATADTLAGTALRPVARLVSAALHKKSTRHNVREDP
jgi:hypothetical protein